MTIPAASGVAWRYVGADGTGLQRHAPNPRRALSSAMGNQRFSCSIPRTAPFRDGTAGLPPGCACHTTIAPTNSPAGAVYKGLAIDSADGTLFAANFNSGEVEMYNSSFGLVKSFTDPNIPKGYAPFNLSVINGKLYVTFAKQDAAKHDDESGPGHGFVDVFDLDGEHPMRLDLEGGSQLALGFADRAPRPLELLAGDLLVGNFGDGRINAYDPTTGAFEGALLGTDGKPLSITDLWALTVGNGSAAGGSPNTLYFTAGLEDEGHGLFGSLSPVLLPTVPELSTWAMMTLGFAGLAFAGYRRARRARVAPM